jgi:hypothetical protein
LVGYVMSQACGKRGWIANLTMVILVLGALPGVLNNPSRPMIGDANTFIVDRDNQYFTNRPSLLSPYAGVARYLAGTSCKSIGLILGEDDWEYPLLVLLQEYGGHSMRMEHVNVFNGSKRIGEENPYFADFQPCAVIIVNSNPPPEIFVKEINYMQKWFSDPIGVYMRP